MIQMNATTLFAIIGLSVIVGAAIVANIVSRRMPPQEPSEREDDPNDAW